MSKKKHEAPEDYKGPRTPIRLRSRCGWCMGEELDSEQHAKCKRETAWYEKLWVCGCPCADEHWNTVAKVETSDDANDDGEAERVAGEDSSEAPASSDEAGS